MSRRIFCVAVLLLGQVCWCSVGEAQIGRRILNRRAAMAVPPQPGAPAPAPYGPYGSLRGMLALRLQQRLDLVAQQEKQPTPAAPAPANKQTAAKAGLGLPGTTPQLTALREPMTRMLSQNEVSSLDTQGLQNALEETQGQLLNELRQFSSAASWQGFLTLPSGVLQDGSMDEAAIQTALSRYDRIAANRNFAQIAALASFNQSRALLTELATRASGPILTSAKGDTAVKMATAEEAVTQTAETLPAPQTTERPLLSKGERSILVRSR